MEIFNAVESDWRDIKEIRLAGLEQSPDAFGSTFEHESVQPDEFWIKRMQRDRVEHVLARIDGLLVGIMVLAPAWREGAGGIFGVWVRPEARGLNVGNALLEQVIKRGRAAGFDRLLLEVGDENSHAIALYARHGFEPTGETTCLEPPREHIKEHERVLML